MQIWTYLLPFCSDPILSISTLVLLLEYHKYRNRKSVFSYVCSANHTQLSTVTFLQAHTNSINVNLHQNPEISIRQTVTSFPGFYLLPVEQCNKNTFGRLPVVTSDHSSTHTYTHNKWCVLWGLSGLAAVGGYQLWLLIWTVGWWISGEPIKIITKKIIKAPQPSALHMNKCVVKLL